MSRSGDYLRSLTSTNASISFYKLRQIAEYIDFLEEAMHELRDAIEQQRTVLGPWLSDKVKEAANKDPL